MQWSITWIVLQRLLFGSHFYRFRPRVLDFTIGIQAVSAKRNKHLKPDRDTNLNDPRSEVDRSDCNLRLVWSSMEQKIEFSIAKSGFRLA